MRVYSREVACILKHISDNEFPDFQVFNKFVTRLDDPRDGNCVLM